MEEKEQKQFSYPIGGVTVKFPCKPYPTQLQMMSKIIQAINKKENALLESPTGSGKSLALLCSSLAWLKQGAVGTPDQSSFKHNVTNSGNKCDCPCHESPVSCATTITPHHATNTSVIPNATIVSSVPPNATIVSSVPPNATVVSSIPSTSVIPNATIVSSVTNASSVAPNVSSVPSTSVTPAATVVPGVPNTTPVLSVSSGASMIPNSTIVPNQHGPVPVLNPVSMVPLVPSVLTPVGLQPLLPIGMPFSPEVLMQIQPLISQISPSLLTQGIAPGIAHKSLESSNVKVHETSQCVKSERENCDGDSDFMPSRTSKKRQHSVKRKRPKIEYEGDDDEVSKEPQPTWEMKIKNETLASKATPLTSPPVTPNPAVVPSLTATPSEVPCHKCGCGSCVGEPSTGHATRRIFYGTRTHKQIKQIIRELRKTAYSSVRMVILGSREHTCIHPDVSQSKNKNEECKKLLDYAEGTSCMYFYKVQQRLGSQSRLKEYNGFNDAWDIEDLVGLGKRIKACPYFATRNLVEEAEIVFCPYNYLIDPKIRKQMLIDIAGQVLVLDEAHNMEDASRGAASLEVTDGELNDVKEELSDIMRFISTQSKYELLTKSYRVIIALISSFISWMENKSDSLPETRYEESLGIWNGTDFLPIMKDLGITDQTKSFILDHLNMIFNSNNNSKSNEEEDLSPPIPSTGTSNLLEALFTVIGYVHNYKNDYRIALKKSTQYNNQKRRSGQWKRRNRPEKVWVLTLYFWCLNPAVAFSELSVARSIILTSGTLSPMSSFASELGTAFPIQLEANHVISQSQTWVHTLSHGPNGHPLNGSYQFSEKFEFQDELGELILRVCETVPYGVLCFLSSYKMMDKLMKRWQDNGTWYQIQKRKHIVYEPRSGNKEDFEQVMLSFYDCISRAVDGTLQQEMNNSDLCHDGAIFFAVCRGKVSEGLDFADDNARAVITVGIPFPSIMDKQVSLKKEYNSELCRKRGLLHGNDWYEIQAYRALNQALGRCIRHKQDWGAIILVDARYGKGEKYTKGLSKWVRGRVRHQPRFSDALSSLQSFVKGRLSSSPLKDESTSLNYTMSEQSSIISPSIKNDPRSDSVLNPKPQDSFLFSPPLSIPPSSTPVRLNKATNLSTSTPLHLKNIPTPSSTSPIEIDISPAHDHTHNPTKNNGRGSTGSPILFGSEASCSPIKGNTKLIDTSEQPLTANQESCDYHMDGDLITIIESPVKMTIGITPPTTEASIKSNTDHLVNQEKENTLTEGNIHSDDLCRNEMLIKPSTMKDEAPPMLSISQRTAKALGTPNETDTPTKMTTIPNTATKAPPTINESATTPKPLLRSTRKRNARMAANSTKKKQLKDEESYEEEEDSDFQSNIRRTGRKNLKQKSKRQQADTTSSTSIISDCDCGSLLTEEMKNNAVCLSSLFSNRDDLTNSLLYHTLDIHNIEDQNIVCIPRESQVMNHIEKVNTTESLSFSSSLFHLNSIWDDVLGLCYSPWRCGCGQTTGVEVYCSTTPNDSLVNKVIMKMNRM